MHALSASIESENATNLDHPVQTVFGRCASKRLELRICYDEPSFSLNKTCVYAEDTIKTHFAEDPWHGKSPLEKLRLHNLPFADSSLGVDPSSHESLQQSSVDMVMRTFGSFDNILAISMEFFTGTHQRISAISRLRFDRNLQSLTTRPCADFSALCLCILLIQQTPTGKMTKMQSSLYTNVKNFISLLEITNGISLDLVHCRVLITFYEMGHGLHTAAYLSLAAVARAARVFGLHRKRWRAIGTESDSLNLEEEKRTWWAIVVMDRFLNLCNGDALFVTEDPERMDPLPILDLVWSEGSTSEDLEGLINAPPFLDTPFNVAVGQMARECQIAHLAGRVVRHVFDPIPDSSFSTEEAFQLERTLKAYLPLLANEELKIGKYCGAYGVCNRLVMRSLTGLRTTVDIGSNGYSALFILYEFMLSRNTENVFDRHQVLLSIEETSIRVLTFAEASYCEREENYPSEILSPYLPYSLCQAAIVQHRLWKQTGFPICKQRLDILKNILKEFTHRWMVACESTRTDEILRTLSIRSLT
jgi:transcription factor-like protein